MEEHDKEQQAQRQMDVAADVPTDLYEAEMHTNLLLRDQQEHMTALSELWSRLVAQPSSPFHPDTEVTHDNGHHMV